MSRSSTAFFSCGNKTERVQLKHLFTFHEVLRRRSPATISGLTLTMSLAAGGAGWGAGLMSFKVSDRRSRASRAPLAES